VKGSPFIYPSDEEIECHDRYLEAQSPRMQSSVEYAGPGVYQKQPQIGYMDI